MCGYICWQGDHKCFEKEEENDLLGVDVKKIKDDYKNCVFEETFKCEMCNFKSTSMKTVRSHFLNKHREDYRVKCWNCDKQLSSILELRKHVGTYQNTLQSKTV